MQKYRNIIQLQERSSEEADEDIPRGSPGSRVRSHSSCLRRFSFSTSACVMNFLNSISAIWSSKMSTKSDHRDKDASIDSDTERIIVKAQLRGRRARRSQTTFFRRKRDIFVDEEMRPLRASLTLRRAMSSLVSGIPAREYAARREATARAMGDHSVLIASSGHVKYMGPDVFYRFRVSWTRAARFSHL